MRCAINSSQLQQLRGKTYACIAVNNGDWYEQIGGISSEGRNMELRVMSDGSAQVYLEGTAHSI